MNTSGKTACSPETYVRIRELAKTLLKGDGTPNFSAIGREVGVAKETVARTLRKDPIKGENITYPPFVGADEDEPIEDILARMRKGFERKAKAQNARKWFPIKLKEDKPYGVILFGDPHLDDNGCNFPLLESHLEIARKPGVYGVNIGDTTNNWTGRLMRLYAQQDTSELTAKRLAEWFMFEAGVTWLCWILGNHDDWNGGADFHKRLGGNHIPIIDWRAQFEIKHPGGTSARMDASHGRKGSSIWNNLHATLRAAKLGELADCYVTGHTHTFGLEDLEIAERNHSCWLIQLRGYKFLDHYALTGNFAEYQRGASVLAVVDPREDARRKIMCFEDVLEGYDYLEFKRR